MSKDKKEWDETLKLLLEGNDTIASELTVGHFVTLKEELFQKMIEEINTARLKNSTDGDVELIMVTDDDSEFDSED